MTERERKLLRGGTFDPVTQDEAAIKYAIDNAGGGGGSDLPTPGTAGNVLTSTGDGWESAAPPESDNDYIIEADLTVDIATQSFGVSPVEHDIADVYAAAAANKNIRLIAVNDTLGIRVAIDAVLSQSQEFFIFSGTMTGFDGKPIAFVVTADDDKDAAVPTIKFTAVTVPTLPAPISNGFVLGVDNGAYALVNVMPYIMHATVSGSTVTLTDGDVAEAIAAKNAGRVVQLEYTDSNMGATLTLEMSGRSYTDDDNCAASFSGNTCDTTAITTEVIMLFKSSGTTTGVDYKYDHSVSAGQ